MFVNRLRGEEIEARPDREYDADDDEPRDEAEQNLRNRRQTTL
jgi:hypothetical protein